MIDRGRARLWLLVAGLLALSLSTALLARAQSEAGSGTTAPGSPSSTDAAELNARLDDLLTRAEERLLEASPNAATLGAEVVALRRDLATARAQIEILKSAIVESVMAHSTAEAELRRLKGEPSAGASRAPGGADPAMTRVLNFAEELRNEPPAAGRTRSLRSSATGAPASATGTAADPLLVTEIHFNPGHADLTPGGRRKTVEAAERLGSLPQGKVRVVGHTDTVGGTDYNKHLALRRADSIAGLLAELGVARERIEIVSAGENALPEPTPDQIAEPLNRCAGILLVADGAD